MLQQQGSHDEAPGPRWPRLRWRWRILLVLLALVAVVESRTIVSSWSADATLNVRFRPSSEQHVRYAMHDEIPLSLTVWEPISPNGRLVLFFHAGGWVSGNRRTAGPDSILLMLCEQGYVVVSADYRLVDQGGTFPANLQDCRAALAWCQVHAPEFGAASDQIVLMGASAGAQLATLTAAASPDPRWDAVPADFRPPALAVGIYGIYDFRNSSLADSPDWVRAMVVDDRHRKSASPQSWISPDDPPVLLLAADQDQITPYAQSRDYAYALWAAGVPGGFLTVQQAGHKFEPSWGTPIPNAAGRRSFIADEIERLLEASDRR